MKIAKTLGLWIGIILLAFILFFCYSDYLFHFSLPSQIHYKHTYSIPAEASAERIKELFEKAVYGGVVKELLPA